MMARRAGSGRTTWSLPSSPAAFLLTLLEMVRELTERQQEIARLLAEGLSDREIAARLGIRRATMRGHIEAMLHRLALADRHELHDWAVQHGRAR